jgi:hypothetical protein
MRFCIGGEHQQVAGGGLAAPLSGWMLVRIHAVRMLAGQPEARTICDLPYEQLDTTTDWESHLARMGVERCAACEAQTGSA